MLEVVDPVRRADAVVGPVDPRRDRADPDPVVVVAAGRRAERVLLRLGRPRGRRPCCPGRTRAGPWRPAPATGVGEGLNSIVHEYEACVDWTNTSPATTAATATTTMPTITVRYFSRNVGSGLVVADALAATRSGRSGWSSAGGAAGRVGRSWRPGGTPCSRFGQASSVTVIGFRVAARPVGQAGAAGPRLRIAPQRVPSRRHRVRNRPLRAQGSLSQACVSRASQPSDEEHGQRPDERGLDRQAR